MTHEERVQKLKERIAKHRLEMEGKDKTKLGEAIEKCEDILLETGECEDLIIIAHKGEGESETRITASTTVIGSIGQALVDEAKKAILKDMKGGLGALLAGLVAEREGSDGLDELLAAEDCDNCDRKDACPQATKDFIKAMKERRM